MPASGQRSTIGNAMCRNRRQSLTLLIAILAVLLLRGLTPDGYMPASPGSGLLFELCPDGMPAEIMQALAGGGHHHHHGGADKGGDAVSATEQCPIGHMLASAAVHNPDVAADLPPGGEVPTIAPVLLVREQHRNAYRSRAPPA